MSAENQPSNFIEPGETITVETYDCYQGQLLPEGSTFKNFDRRFGNPATGPNSGAMKEYFPEPVIRRMPECSLTCWET